MFNRKKRIYEKKGFYILIMSVLLIALGIFAVPWGGGENADASNTAAQTPVPDEEDNWWEDDEDDEEYTDDDNADNTENTDENRQQNKLLKVKRKHFFLCHIANWHTSNIFQLYP